MAEIGKEHRIFNVKYPPKRETPDGGEVFRPADGFGRRADNDSIQSAIDALSQYRKSGEMPGFVGHEASPRVEADNEKQGGIVYFPPGTYRIEARPLPDRIQFIRADGALRQGEDPLGPKHRASIYVPPDVTLEFAPGAVLRLEARGVSAPIWVDGARVEIEGGLRADLYQIFDVRWRTLRSSDDAEDRSAPGAVIFSGAEMKEILPEWWGAAAVESNRGVTDSWRALQDAFDAAYRDRAALDEFIRGGRRGATVNQPTAYTPIPIRLTQRYVTSKPLILEADVTPGDSPRSSGFRLSGSQAVGDKPTLIGQFEAGARTYAIQQGVPLAVLFIKRGIGFEVENVGFEAQNSSLAVLLDDWARTGVWIESGSRVGGVSLPRATGSAPAQMSRFHRCTFSSAVGNIALRELVHVGGGEVGTTLGGIDPDVPPDDPKKRPRNVFFSDDLLGLTFDQCRFVVAERGQIGNGTEGPDARHYAGRENAIGVVANAGNALPVQFNTCFFSGFAKRFVDAVVGEIFLSGTGFHNTNRDGVDIFLNRPGDEVTHTAPAGITVIQCDSQSWSFLASYAGPGEAVPNLGVTLIACTHHNVQLGYLDDAEGLLGRPGGRVGRGLAVFNPPSIDWHNGGVLHLIGCNFDSDVKISDEANCVVDVGTRFSASRGGSGTTTVRGGRFEGNLSKLRGVAGLPTWVDPTAHAGNAMTNPALRMGGNLLLTDHAQPGPEYPWKTGDVWLQKPTPHPSDVPEAASTTLGIALHKVWRHGELDASPVSVREVRKGLRIVRELPNADNAAFGGWEDVFGSENYSGPWDVFFDAPNLAVVMDGAIQVVPGAIYEVLWAIHTHAQNTTLAPELRALGRDTVEAFVGQAYGGSADAFVELRITPVSSQGRQRLNGTTSDTDVRLDAIFVPRVAGVESREMSLSDVRAGRGLLRLVFDHIWSKPWIGSGAGLERLYKVVVRRLL